MGWADAEMRCKKHPQHRQTPGVCSYCLRERLIKLQLSSRNNNGTGTKGSSCSSSSSSFPYSSGATSSYSSPLHDRYRFGYSDRRAPESLFLKSRSAVAFGPKMMSRKRVAVEGTDGKKKVGFWSKLIRSTGKKTKKILLHSRTVRDISSPNRIY